MRDEPLHAPDLPTGGDVYHRGRDLEESCCVAPAWRADHGHDATGGARASDRCASSGVRYTQPSNTMVRLSCFHIPPRYPSAAGSSAGSNNLWSTPLAPPLVSS